MVKQSTSLQTVRAERLQLSRYYKASGVSTVSASLLLTGCHLADMNGGVLAGIGILMLASSLLALGLLRIGILHAVQQKVDGEAEDLRKALEQARKNSEVHEVQAPEVRKRNASPGTRVLTQPKKQAAQRSQTEEVSINLGQQSKKGSVGSKQK